MPGAAAPRVGVAHTFQHLLQLRERGRLSPVPDKPTHIPVHTNENAQASKILSIKKKKMKNLTQWDKVS